MDAEIREKMLTLLDQHRIMTIATLRPDGWPQATTVGYANEGLTLYFLCLRDSQKAANLARDDRVSLTIDHDTPEVMATTGLSMAARASSRRPGRSEQGLAHASDEISWTLPAIADAVPGKHQDLPRDADGHIRTRLLEGLWTHGSGHLLRAFLRTWWERDFRAIGTEGSRKASRSSRGVRSAPTFRRGACRLLGD